MSLFLPIWPVFFQLAQIYLLTHVSPLWVRKQNKMAFSLDFELFMMHTHSLNLYFFFVNACHTKKHSAFCNPYQYFINISSLLLIISQSTVSIPTGSPLAHKIDQLSLQSLQFFTVTLFKHTLSLVNKSLSKSITQFHRSLSLDPLYLYPHLWVHKIVSLFFSFFRADGLRTKLTSQGNLILPPSLSLFSYQNLQIGRLGK